MRMAVVLKAANIRDLAHCCHTHRADNSESLLSRSGVQTARVLMAQLPRQGGALRARSNYVDRLPLGIAYTFAAQCPDCGSYTDGILTQTGDIFGEVLARLPFSAVHYCGRCSREYSFPHNVTYVPPQSSVVRLQYIPKY